MIHHYITRQIQDSIDPSIHSLSSPPAHDYSMYVFPGSASTGISVTTGIAALRLKAARVPLV